MNKCDINTDHWKIEFNIFCELLLKKNNKEYIQKYFVILLILYKIIKS